MVLSVWIFKVELSKCTYRVNEYDQEMPQLHKVQTNPRHNEEEIQNTNSKMTLKDN